MTRGIGDLRRPAVAASILAADFTRLGDEVVRVEAAGADVLHVDVMDGHFVRNLSLGPRVLESIRAITELALDVHLMVEDPDRFIEAFATAGADNLTFHVETVADPASLARRIHAQGCSVGAALDVSGAFERLVAAVPYVDLVLVMTVHAGSGGQNFLAEMLPRVECTRGLLRPDQRLEIDGGLTPAWARRAIGAGADILVSGTSIFRAGDYQRAIRALREGTIEGPG